MIDSVLKKLPVHMVVLLASLSLCAAGCGTSGRTLDARPESLASSVSIGDHLLVETIDGEELDIHVTDVDESGIWGGGRYIAYTDIQSVRIQPDNSKNSDALVILVAAVLVIGAVWLVSEIDSGFDEGIYQSND